MSIAFEHLRNYVRMVNREEKYTPHFQKHLSRDITYGIKNFAEHSENDTFTSVIAKIKEAPKSVRQPTGAISIDELNGISDFQQYRTRLRKECKHNPEANDYIIGLRKQVLNISQPAMKHLGNLTHRYTQIQLDILKKNGTGPSRECITETEKIMERLSEKSLYRHVCDFLDYVTNKKGNNISTLKTLNREA